MFDLSTIKTLASARDMITQANAKISELEATAARVGAVDSVLETMGIDPASCQSPAEIVAAINEKAETRGSARALQITAAQGSDTPLPATGEQAGTSAASQATGRARWKNLKL